MCVDWREHAVDCVNCFELVVAIVFVIIVFFCFSPAPVRPPRNDGLSARWWCGGVVVVVVVVQADAFSQRLIRIKYNNDNLN